MNPDVTPIAQPIRKVPIHLEERVEEKLNEMLRQNIVEMVNEPREWISPMVVVLKPDKSVRICIDMRQANKAILREKHPLPSLDDILPRLSGAKLFTKFDVKNAFHQIELGKTSRFITTFITRRGLMQYTRLIFGINNAPELFQKTMERILMGCKGTVVYLDDILIYGGNKGEHDENVRQVTIRLEKANVLLNEKKTELGKTSVQFMGHDISIGGVKASTEKLEAVRSFRKPETPEETRSFLGLITYLSRFLPNLSTTAEPLRTLIKETMKPFEWKQVHEEAFEKIKQNILKGATLSFYNKNDETIVICDASPYGLGAVLLQKAKGQRERIIMFISKTLTQPERRYCQTEREALAIVWSIEKFRYYLYGRSFTLYTDHKPLTFMFQPTAKPCARIERWILRLQQYEFTVRHKSGKENIADPFSRMSATDKNPETFDEESEHYVNAIVDMAVTSAVSLEQIKEAGETDEEFKMLKKGLQSGCWEDSVKKWRNLSAEFCMAKGVILRGKRMYIPEGLRGRILRAAHEGHPGHDKLLHRLRERVWWPMMTKDAETISVSCQACTLVSAPDKPVPMKMRELPSGPWKELAIDFMATGSFGKKLLVIVDYYSRYVDIRIQNGETAAETIGSLQEIFPILGYPESLTTDNGEPFVSGEFQDFCKNWAIKLIHTPPLYAQANGLVERVNRGIKKRLQISNIEGRKEWKSDLLVNYLVMYRSTIHKTTGKSPYELMFGRKMKEKIPFFNGNVVQTDDEVREHDQDQKRKIKQRADASRGAKESDLEVGDKVFLKSKPGEKLTPNFNPEMYTVQERKDGDCEVKSDENGVVRRRHITFLKKAHVSNQILTPTVENQILTPEHNTPEAETTKSTPQAALRKRTETTTTTRSPSKRRKTAPKKLDDYVRAMELL